MDIPTTTQIPLQADASAASGIPPLIIHITDTLDRDTDDNLLSLLHQMPPGRYRHVILGWRRRAMWELRHCGHVAQWVHMAASTGGFPPDGGLPAVRLFRRLRYLRPALIHTHSTALQWLAALAGVPLRLDGASASECAPRRRGLRSWLGRLLTPAPPPRAHAAVDCAHFHPRLGPPAALGPAGFICEGACVIASAGPIDAAHVLLVEAFLQLLAMHGAATPLRLLLVGDGPQRSACKARLAAAGAGELAWLPGQRDDVARLLRLADIYAAPGCTPQSATHVLQAMATGLPVVASQGGAHGWLVQSDWTGQLVPQGDPAILAEALADYVRIAGMARRHGMRGRRQVLRHHSLATVAQRYTQLYDRLLQRGGLANPGRHPDDA